jgi:hypothetical protein
MKQALGRPRRRWEGNIKMELREAGFEASVRFIFLMMATDGWVL